MFVILSLNSNKFLTTKTALYNGELFEFLFNHIDIAEDGGPIVETMGPINFPDFRIFGKQYNFAIVCFDTVSLRFKTRVTKVLHCFRKSHLRAPNISIIGTYNLADWLTKKFDNI